MSSSIILQAAVRVLLPLLLLYAVFLLLRGHNDPGGGFVAGLVLNNAGCFLNIYSSYPNTRMTQLLNNSEDLRQIEQEWMRIWFTDQPSHMTYDRIHGGIQ